MSARLTKEQAIAQLWRQGILAPWKLYAYQMPIYEKLKSSRALKFVLNCSRRFGKTTILCVFALEFALTHKGAQIRFAAPTAKALRKIIHPIFKKLIADAPEGVKPIWRGTDGYYFFPSSQSELHIAGCDNGNVENLRGQASDLNLIDEAGFISDLDYVLQDVLIPQTLTTGGLTFISSTPPRTPAHDFFEIAQEAKAQGNYACYTIDDNQSLTPERIQEYAKEAGGRESSTFKREYLCQFVVDDSSQIIPEWNDGFIAEPTQDEFTRFWHRYDGMDLGVKRDKTACLFGHYNFNEARFYALDEFAMNGPDMTTDKLKDAIRAKELDLWGEDYKPYRRISDNNNPLLLQDLGSLHGLHFAPVLKDELHAMVNEARLWVSKGRLRVAPRCEQLLGCLKYGVWDQGRKEFDRSKVYGHFDALAALIYLLRSIDQHVNPVPHDYGFDRRNAVIKSSPLSQTQKTFKKLFERPPV